jgi:hypothetical protein
MSGQIRGSLQFAAGALQIINTEADRDAYVPTPQMYDVPANPSININIPLNLSR